MKVLHVCSYYIGSKLYSNMVSNLDELGIENEVYIPINSDKLIHKNYVESLPKTNFIYSKAFNTIDRFNFKLKTKKIYKDLLNKVDLDTIDVVHAHSLFVNGYIAYKLKKEKNINYIVAVRNTDLNVFFKYMPWLRSLGIKILEDAEKIIFLSESYKTNVLDKYIKKENRSKLNSKAYVIPNGVDKFWLNNFNNNEFKKNKYNKINIIYVGDINRNKNVIATIKALDNLITKGYKFEFYIIGTGKYLRKLERLKKNGRRYINLLGKKEQEELLELYRKSDIFVMPSRKETFGLVYVEALTQGLPVIYTRNQGFDGYFKDGDVGYSVKCNDIKEIENKIEMLIENYINISNYNEEIKFRFDWKNICEIYLELYKISTNKIDYKG